MADRGIIDIATNAYSCDNCGAPLVYQPGSNHLVCKHCGTVKEISQGENLIEESDFNEYLENFEEENLETTKVVICSNCKATPTVDENLQSMLCPYCGSPLVASDIHQERYIKPDYVFPFQIEKGQVNSILAAWIKGRWFAPNKLQKAALDALNIHGVYMPYWTYDADAVTDYTGQRGDAYYVTVGSGKNRRTERRIRWSYASGRVQNFYDDVLVAGSRTLNSKILSDMGGWDTHNVLKINDSYLIGFVTEKYQINLRDAFVTAQSMIESSERNNVRYDIGGDEQRIHSMDTKYYNVKFKHVLLPIYVCAFRYRDKLYTFYVNGATGKLSGERPYSKVKIFFAVLAGLIAALAFYYFVIREGS